MIDLTQDRLVSAEELSERLSIPVSTIRWYARIGRLPSVKIGRLVRFPLKEVERTLEEQLRAGERL